MLVTWAPATVENLWFGTSVRVNPLRVVFICCHMDRDSAESCHFLSSRWPLFSIFLLSSRAEQVVDLDQLPVNLVFIAISWRLFRRNVAPINPMDWIRHENRLWH